MKFLLASKFQTQIKSKKNHNELRNFYLTSEFGALGGAGSSFHEAVEVIVDEPVTGQNLVDVDAVVLVGVLVEFVGGGREAGGGHESDDEQAKE